MLQIFKPKPLIIEFIRFKCGLISTNCPKICLLKSPHLPNVYTLIPTNVALPLMY